MLPDRSILIGQKLVENDKIQKFKCDILGDFQTLCASLIFHQQENIVIFQDLEHDTFSFPNTICNFLPI